MEAIRHYLQSEDPDYEEGVRLLGQNTKNRNLVQQLSRKESVNTWAKLRYELAKVAGDVELAMLPLPLVADVPPPPAEEEEQEELEQEGADLGELAKQLTPEALAEVEGIAVEMQGVYNRKVAASNSLGDVTSRADRQRVVDEIQTLEDQYNALAEKKRLVIERGTPTPVATAPEEVVPTLAEALKNRNNLRSNLSKARGNGAKAKSEAKKSEYEQKAGRLAVELEEAELLLKKLQEG